MRNAMLLLMDDPASGSTLMEIPRLLADAEFRKYKLSKSKNQIVIDFWTKEAEKAGGEAALVNMVPYITSKLTQFTSNDIMRPMIGQQNSSFDFRKAMDEKKIILVTLPKGLLGEMNAKLLGMIIAGKIQIAAFSRQNVSEEERVPFFLYVDEFQNFTSNTFATILSEARKYRLSLNITHQYIEQLDEIHAVQLWVT
jgi:type IV secretory pathway TraG/TraD family ATPase VirD4